MSPIKKTTRRVPLALAVIVTGCCVAACGSASSSSSSSTATSSVASASATSTGSASRSARRAALVACLKSHGVTLPARPPSGSGGAGAGPGAGGGFFGGAVSNPKLAAALRACGGFRFRGGGARFRQVSHQEIDKYVTCVRQHGFDMPNPNFSGKGPVFPASIRSNEKFQSASRSCQSLLVRPPTTSSSSATNSA